ncbi:MAG: replicative DNA helicase [Holophagales bacterium]|jgi:replicative DNA helicase|nr:replicative DNA helicase [Holophagales bacterium]
MAEWLPERLPEDIEAERSLLATCCAPGLEREAADVVFRLTEEDFVHPAHRAVFHALVRLLENNLEVNAITLKDVLAQAGDLSRVGDFAGLVELLSAEEVRNPQILADLLIRKRKFRELIRLGAQLVRRAAEEEVPPETLVEQAGQELFRTAQGQDARGLEHIAHVAQESYQNLLDRLEGRGSSGLRVGFSRLDTLTQGFQPGNLIVLAARPGIGKTALALNWLLHASTRFRAHTAFFSLEMSKEEVFNRLLASCSQVNLKAVTHGGFSESIHKKLLEARDELINQPIFICDKATVTSREISAMVDRLCTQSNQKLDLVIVDYLQLISSPSDSRGAKQTESVRIGEISRSLKLLAKERNIPVVILSQLNREVEHRQGGRPQLSDLRDSGAIEQDADIVIFIHRKMKPVMEGEEPEKSAELLVAKHRNGPTGMIPLWFEGEYALFRELERYSDGPEG